MTENVMSCQDLYNKYLKEAIENDDEEFARLVFHDVVPSESGYLVNRIIYNEEGFYINFKELRERFGLFVYYDSDKNAYNINHMRIIGCPPTVQDCILDYNSRLTINLLRYIFNLAKERINAYAADADDAARDADDAARDVAYAAGDAAAAAAARGVAYAAQAAGDAARDAAGDAANAAARYARNAGDAARNAGDAARYARDARYAAEMMDIAIQKIEEYIKIVEGEKI